MGGGYVNVNSTGNSYVPVSLRYNLSGGSWTLASETRYLYSGRLVVQERNSANTPTVTYTRGIDLSGTLEGAGGIGGLLARSSGYSSGSWSTHNFYHADGNGNITYLVNSAQGLAASYRYDPWGNLAASSGTFAAANVYRFSSKEHHANSGLYYYGYRFYDPTLQRWLNQDPIQERGGFNMYGFVAQNPINNYDALGLEPIYGPDGYFDPSSACHAPSPCDAAIDAAKSAFGNISNDARAHCVHSCEIAKACGRGAASLLGTLKEGRDIFAGGLEWTLSWILPKSLEERLHDNIQGGNINDSAADFFANHYGLDAAKYGENCVTACEKQFGTEP